MKRNLHSLSLFVGITILMIPSAFGQFCTSSTSQQNATCNGLCNGSATVTAGFFRPAPLTYSWNTNPVQTTQTATGLCAGTYIGTITDGNGCVTHDNFTITQPAAINSSTTQTNVSCHGGANGTATITVSGGGTYTYSWNTSPIQTTQTATNLSAGTYTVVATRTSSGCTTTKTVTITEPSAIILSATATPSLCGQANGTATITGSGGTGTLQFGWNTNPIQYGQTATGLAPGTYTGGAQDANGCQVSTTVIVTNSGGPSLSFSVTSNTCPGAHNATATVTPTGGTSPYSYSWNTQPAQTTQTATGLSAGEYQVIVTDHDGCGSTQSVQITDPTPVTITTTVTDALCVGASSGTANAVGHGGTSPYSYFWDSWPVQTTQTATGLSAGVFNVTVTDNNGCNATQPVTIGEPPVLYINTASTNVTCFGLANGTATSNPYGGTPGYTFSWNTNPVQTTQTAVNLSAGTYSVISTDANGCTIFSTVGISEPPEIIATTTTTNSGCGQSNGSATVTASGGTGTLSYSWNTNPVQTTAIAHNLSVGTYSITVTDQTGCTKTATAIVQNSGGLTLNVAKTNVSCNGGNNGTASVTVTGGSPGYSYLWNTQPTQTTQNAFGLVAGTYTVTVTDQAGCTSISSATITQPSAISLTTTQNNISCFGGLTGSANAVISGGVSPYTFSWNTNPVQTSQNISGLGAGSYIVTATDAQGCNRNATVTITQPQSGLSVTAVHTNVSCFGGTNGSATANPLNGTSPYTYSWNTQPVQTTQTAVSLTAGVFTVSVTDVNGCSILTNTTVTAPPQLAVEMSSTTTSCNVADGTASANVSGGSPGYTYIWNSNPAQTTSTATGLSSGLYTVTVSDSHSCTQTASIAVTNQSGLNAEITATHVSCYGGNNGTATMHVSGGTPNYSFAWNTNPVQTTATASNLAAGNYTATVTDGGGCVFAAEIIITQPEELNVLTAVYNIQCNGQQNGSIKSTVLGGVSPYNYLWNTNPVQTTDSISGLGTGDYTLTVNDDNGCIVSNTYSVTEPASPLSASVIQSNVSCNGGNNGSATSNTQGGTPPYSYLWSTFPVQTTQTAISLTAGNLLVVITDDNGCTTTKNVTITQPGAINIVINSNNPACSQNDGTATAIVTGGVGPYNYSWSTNPVQTTESALGLVAGNYTVTITDDNGCIETKDILLNNVGGPTLSVNYSDVSCFGMNNGTATVSPSGGTSPYSVLWNTDPAQTTETIIGLSPRNYNLTVSDVNGCTTLTSVTITQPDELTAITNSVNPSCSNCFDGSASVTPSGGNSPYVFSWNTNPVQTTSTATGLADGTYTVTVTDDNGCETSASVTLTALITGIDNVSISENSFIVYPNPTSGTITVELETIGNTTFTLTLTNLLGDNLWTKENEASGKYNQTIDLSSFAEGIYIIMVRSENATLLRKVLKK